MVMTPYALDQLINRPSQGNQVSLMQKNRKQFAMQAPFYEDN
jgi:hypothetical protein